MKKRIVTFIIVVAMLISHVICVNADQSRPPFTHPRVKSITRPIPNHSNDNENQNAVENKNSVENEK